MLRSSMKKLEDKPAGFNPICYECGKDLCGNLSIRCEKCCLPYCSKKCLEKEKKEICVPPSGSEAFMACSGLNVDEKQVVKFNGIDYLPMPGPIKIGKIPRGLWDTNIGEAMELKKQLTQKGIDTQDWYYLVSVYDFNRITNFEITQIQDEELNLIFSVNISERKLKSLNDLLSKATQEIHKSYYRGKITEEEHLLKMTNSSLEKLRHDNHVN